MLSYTLLLLYVGGVLGLFPIDGCKIGVLSSVCLAVMCSCLLLCCVHVFYYESMPVLASLGTRFVVSGFYDCKLSVMLDI